LFEYNWDTFRAGDGTYTLLVTGTFISRTGGPPIGVPVGPRNVTVKHGYKLVEDAAKSYAKVLSPAEGATIAAGAQFTVTTSHQLTYERFDDCGTYSVSYKFRNHCSYDNTDYPAGSGIVAQPPPTRLPYQVGEFPLDSINLTDEQHYHNIPGKYGNFNVEAFTWTSDMGGDGEPWPWNTRDTKNFVAAQP